MFPDRAFSGYRKELRLAVHLVTGWRSEGSGGSGGSIGGLEITHLPDTDSSSRVGGIPILITEDQSLSD